ncbi:glutaredoxin domain-containing cysteine-rich protein CG12206-like [Ornithodoros turicata]
MPQRSPTVSIVVNGSPVALDGPNDTDFRHSNGHVVRVSLSLPPLKPDQDERSSSGASSGPGSDDETPFECDFSSVNYNMRSLDSGISMKDLQQDLKASLAVKDAHAKDEYHNGVCFNVLEAGANGYDSDMKFHMKELDGVVNHVSNGAREDEHPLDAALANEQAILSRQGTVRGVKNLVRASIKCIVDSQDGRRNYSREEAGRVVLYTTSMGVIRHTWEQCRRVKNILQTLLVRFEERDVFMNRSFQKEIMERTGMPHVVVPHMFVEGHLLGGAELVERLNETGELRQMLKPYKKTCVGGTCPMCGGYQYLPCPVCGGSKKSTQHRHRFSSSIIYLRCLNCDEGGLVRCEMCLHGDG